MRFYFPDSQDQVDPEYDFLAEEHPPLHVFQRDDRYAHELHDAPPYDGILVSRTTIDGQRGNGGRYRAAQRHRLYRVGIHRFFRLPPELEAIGDCGAFSYVDEPVPPVTVDETIDFYEAVGVDEGVSVDHVVLAFGDDERPPEPDWIERRELTLTLAKQFLAEHRRRGCAFTPMGVAQGWSPSSYAESIAALQEQGYERIAIGGIAPLKANQILACLTAVDAVRAPDTQLHLLGVSRAERYRSFAEHGVASLDSTSPFRQAFTDDRDNYYAPDAAERSFVALRIPPSETNSKLRNRIRAGALDQREIQAAERASLTAARAYDRGELGLEDALAALLDYERLAGIGTRDYAAAYRRTLEARPWADCPCSICRRWGVEVAIFRGIERNKRRGFHNLWVFEQRLRRHGRVHELV